MLDPPRWLGIGRQQHDAAALLLPALQCTCHESRTQNSLPQHQRPAGFFVCKLKKLKNGVKEEGKQQDEEDEDEEEAAGAGAGEGAQGAGEEEAEPTVRVSGSLVLVCSCFYSRVSF